ncbi:MAG: hypothetical protein JWR10_1538 [Rubritepida sp.]|nr:hypothetical protein [Rubritepida sp.]
MSMTRRTLAAAGALMPFAAGLPGARAQEAATRQRLAAMKPPGYPREPIELMVAYPPGGGMDITTRVLQRLFDATTGERSMVNNRTGGAGLIGHTWLYTQAPADGQVVGVIAGLVFSDSARSGGRWNWTDLDHLAHINSEPLNVVVNTEGRFKDATLAEILAEVRARPGTVRIGTIPGGYYDYLVDQLEWATGSRFLRVPFQGGGPGMTALLGNNLDIFFAFYGEVRGHFAANRLKGIGVTGDRESVFLPGQPTVNSVTGRTDINWGVTRWVAAPKAVPADRKVWLTAAFRAAVTSPAAEAEFRNLGAMPDPTVDTPEKLMDILQRESRAETDFVAARAARR